MTQTGENWVTLDTWRISKWIKLNSSILPGISRIGSRPSPGAALALEKPQRHLRRVSHTGELKATPRSAVLGMSRFLRSFWLATGA
jgi:hypothetical protein